MKYFLHDSNAFNDEKISELFINFGYEGLGLFYTALEKLAFQEKPIKTSVLKAQLKIGKRLDKCWNFMETLGILSSNNGETFNMQLLNFSQKYQIKKQKNSERISEWRKNQEDRKNVTSSEHVSNSPKVNRSKVNRSKENNSEAEASLVFPWTSDRFLKTWEVWKKYRLEIKKPYKGIISEQAALKKISVHTEETAIKIIEESISNGWQGLFELKKNNNNGKSNSEPLDEARFQKIMQGLAQNRPNSKG